MLKCSERSDSVSLYGQYLLEREGKFIVEDSRGFATYTYLQDAVYIEDIYVLPAFRKNGVAAEYADAICKIALDKGLHKVIGTVAPSAKNSTSSMAVLLAYGFKLNSSDTNLIYFEKDL